MTNEEYQKEVMADVKALCNVFGLSDATGRVAGYLLAGLLTDIHRIADASERYVVESTAAPPPVYSIPGGVYYDTASGSNFYSVERNAGCGQKFYNQWRLRAGEFPQSREAAIALMPAWLDMKDAPRNATELILRIPQKGHPGYYEQIGHWAEMDGSEQPPCKGWFRNTGDGFVQLPEPTGWRWPIMITPAVSLGSK